MSQYFVNKCIKCKEDHKKPILIKMGKYWCEIDSSYDELCEWCYFGLDYNKGRINEIDT